MKVTIEEFIEYIEEGIKQCDEAGIDGKEVSRAYVTALRNYKNK